MELNESGLCSAMRRSWKGGYHVLPLRTEEGLLLTIAGEGWTVRAEAKHLPRKVLGLLVEHAGEIPDEPMEIRRKMDNQVVLPDVVLGMIEIAYRTDIEREKALPTALTYLGRRIFQRENRRIVCIDPELLDIVACWETEAALVCGGGIAAWFAAGIMVVVSCNGDMPGEAVNWLSGYSWSRMPEDGGRQLEQDEDAADEDQEQIDEEEPEEEDA